MLELIAIAIGLVRLYFAFAQHKKTNVDDLEELRKVTLEKMDFLEVLNSKLIRDLTKWGIENNSHNVHFMQGLTLNQCIEILRRVQQEILTKENIEALKITNSQLKLSDIRNQLEIQIKHHSEVKTYFTYFVLQPQG
jgi:hypothetical protein